MILDRVFIGFMVMVGVAVGLIAAWYPEVREFRVSPYFWVLIAMALFEGLSFAWGRGAPGTTLAMEARIIGFLLAFVLLFVIPKFVGVRPS